LKRPGGGTPEPVFRERKTMSTYDTTAVEGTGTELDERDVRALTEYLTVLPEAPDVYQVVSQSGATYTVDARGGACTCPDFEYRDVRCKHLRRVAFATGERPVPAGVDRDGLDEQLGRHVDGGPRVLATDGGQALERPEITEHREPPKQGGARFWRCAGCGRETIYGADRLPHADGCPGVGRRSD
jgi:hypothetical protein